MDALNSFPSNATMTSRTRDEHPMLFQASQSPFEGHQAGFFADRKEGKSWMSTTDALTDLPCAMLSDYPSCDNGCELSNVEIPGTPIVEFMKLYFAQERNKYLTALLSQSHKLTSTIIPFNAANSLSSPHVRSVVDNNVQQSARSMLSPQNVDTNYFSINKHESKCNVQNSVSSCTSENGEPSHEADVSLLQCNSNDSSGDHALSHFDLFNICKPKESTGDVDRALSPSSPVTPLSASRTSLRLMKHTGSSRKRSTAGSIGIHDAKRLRSADSDCGTLDRETKRARKVKTQIQLQILKDHFLASSRPSKDELTALHLQTKLPINEITRWFRNERHKNKKARYFDAVVHEKDLSTPSFSNKKRMVKERAMDEHLPSDLGPHSLQLSILPGSDDHSCDPKSEAPIPDEESTESETCSENDKAVNLPDPSDTAAILAGMAHNFSSTDQKSNSCKLSDLKNAHKHDAASISANVLQPSSRTRSLKHESISKNDLSAADACISPWLETYKAYSSVVKTRALEQLLALDTDRCLQSILSALPLRRYSTARNNPLKTIRSHFASSSQSIRNSVVTTGFQHSVSVQQPQKSLPQSVLSMPKRSSSLPF